MSAHPVSVLVVFGPETTSEPAGILTDLRAQAGVDLDIVLVDHTDTGALTGRAFGDGVRVVRAEGWALGSAIKQGLAAARHDLIAIREPNSRTDPQWTQRAAEALDSADVVTANYFVSTADGRMAYNIDPARDGVEPPPGWDAALLSTRGFLATLTEEAFAPALLIAYRRALAEQRVVHLADPLFSVSADWFALSRLRTNWTNHLLRVHEGDDFEAATPWLSVLVCADGQMAKARAAVQRIVHQVLPKNTFEILVIDTAEGAVADRVDTETWPIGVRSLRTPETSRVGALNAGLAYAQGVSILVTDTDLLFFPETLEQHIRATREDPVREVVVLGTIEATAADQQTCLGQILGDGSHELGSELTPGEQPDFSVLRLRNLGLPRATLDAVGGFGVGLGDAAAAGDLAQRLYERGAVLTYRDTARALRTDELSLARLGQARREAARARAALVERHPDLAERFEHTPLSELQALLADNAPSRATVEAAALALAECRVAALDPIGDDWRDLSNTLVERTRTLLAHLDRLWTAEGLAAGLEAAGASSLRAIAAGQPEHVPGARSERWLLAPQDTHENGWLMALARYLTGTDDRSDTTLILLANAGAHGCPVEFLQNACQTLTQRIACPRSGQWPHVVIVDESTRDRPLYRLLGGCKGLLTTGSAFDAEVEEALALTDGASDDGTAFAHRSTGGVEPYPYATQAFRRVLAWPDWSDADLDALLIAFRDARAAYGPLALCLRYEASTDPEADVALASLDAAYQRHFAEDDEVEVFLFEAAVEGDALQTLGAGVDAVMVLPSHSRGPRLTFSEGTGAPKAQGTEALLGVLRHLPLAPAAPLQPSLTWTL